MATSRAVLTITVTPAVDQLPPIGRVTRNHVSAYQRGRVHYGEVYASERRVLITDFNGAIPKEASIQSAVWQTQDVMSCRMSAPSVEPRDVRVMLDAQYTGRCRIRVDVTLDDGQVYSAWHVVSVKAAPYFGGENWTQGPTKLEARADG